MSEKPSDRIHLLFEQEVEGRIVTQGEIHELFISDEVNEKMDRALAAPLI